MAKSDIIKELDELRGTLKQAQGAISLKDARIAELEEELNLSQARVRAAYADKAEYERSLDAMYKERDRQNELIAKLTSRYIALEEKNNV